MSLLLKTSPPAPSKRSRWNPLMATIELNSNRSCCKQDCESEPINPGDANATDSTSTRSVPIASVNRLSIDSRGSVVSSRTATRSAWQRLGPPTSQCDGDDQRIAHKGTGPQSVCMLVQEEHELGIHPLFEAPKRSR